MKLIAVICLVLSLNVNAREVRTKVVTGEAAQNLFEALYINGVEIKGDTEAFSMKEPMGVVCSVSREERFSVGDFSEPPLCFLITINGGRTIEHGNMLPNSTTLMNAVANAGGKVEGAAGKAVVSSNSINCSYTTRKDNPTGEYECTIENNHY